MAYEKLRTLLIDPNGYVFDPARGFAYTMNETAVRVIALLRSGCFEHELARRLAAEYDVSLAVAERDVAALLASMRAYQLL